MSSIAAKSSVRIPLALHGLDGRYATALYSASIRTKTTAQAQTDLASIRATLSKDSRANSVLMMPIFSRAVKMARIGLLVKQVPVTPAVSNLLSLLAENARLDLLDSIATKFDDLISAAAGHVSVSPLDKTTLAKLTSMLKASPRLISAGQTPLIKSKIDKEILGGLIIEVDGKTIDMSVSSRVGKINRLIGEAI